MNQNSQNIREKINTFFNRMTKVVQGNNAKSSLHKMKSSIIAILLGLAIGIIPIVAGTEGDVWKTYTALFTKPFEQGVVLNKTIATISVFALLGLGIGISFKTGLFNIGASGQFLMAGAVTVMLGITQNMEKAAAMPVLMLISILVGALVASIAGILKAFFNVHEVVSTILLNWIFFFVVKYIIKLDTFRNANSEASKRITNQNMVFSFRADSYDTWIILGIAIAVAIIFWMVFKFTTFGYQLRVNGLNNQAAKFAGVNNKMTTIYSMALSGAIIGLAGFIFYGSIQGQIPNLDKLPSQGFEAITVTLLAFSSPLGVLPAGLFYGTISQGASAASLAGNVPKETIDLLMGLIIFFAALAPVMVEFRPMRMLNILLFEWLRKDWRSKRKTLNSKIKETRDSFNEEIKELLVDKKIKSALIYKAQNEWLDKMKTLNKSFGKLKFWDSKEVQDSQNKLTQTLADSKFMMIEEKQNEKKVSIRSLKNNYKLSLMEDYVAKGGAWWS